MWEGLRGGWKREGDCRVGRGGVKDGGREGLGGFEGGEGVRGKGDSDVGGYWGGGVGGGHVQEVEGAGDRGWVGR